MISRYQKKPVAVEAVRWTGYNFEEIKSFVGCSCGLRGSYMNPDLIIHTLEGDHHALVGDYIIKGVHGEFYPCKPDIFMETYEEVEPEEYRVGQRSGKALMREAKQLTIQEFMAKNPDFIKPIMRGAVMGTITFFCSDPSQTSYFEDEVDKRLDEILSTPAAEMFKL